MHAGPWDQNLNVRLLHRTQETWQVSWYIDICHDKLCKDNCLQACVTDKLDNSDRINLAMHHA